MPNTLDVSFSSLDKASGDVIVLLAEPKLSFGTRATHLDKASDGHLKRAAKAADFTGAAKSVADVLAPSGIDAKRVIMLGLGDTSAHKHNDWVSFGGRLMAELRKRKLREATVVLDAKGATIDPEIAADIAMGAALRSYAFDAFKSKSSAANDDENGNGNGDAPRTDRRASLQFACKDPSKCEAAYERAGAVGDGVALARDLVNQPANALGPVEFASEAVHLSKVGVEVELLDEKALEKIGMGALLGVAQGSVRPARVVIMRWEGAAKKKTRPVCFVGKGVVFDTGGISLKPAKGMEDMKGDMGGAAAVVGVMHALAARKAPVNAVGIIGLVENMPSGNAQRPGDIVRSLAGKTIEVLNTDAEGRLVLADLLWYAEDNFKPKVMINLATLTGAILAALGKEHAGLFSNDDKLAQRLTEAGIASGEPVWRMPLTPAYDKQIDSKTADMKNIGGPYAGAITAAQFLQRFVRDVPWAHLDVAGMAMGSIPSDVNESWASGYGVRLLDQFVRDGYED